MLLYKLLYTTIECLGFLINTYDRCVSSKMFEGTQCTIDWYVDDNKLLHKNPEVISDIINEVKKHFGEIYVVRLNKHNLLVINIYIKDNTI